MLTFTFIKNLKGSTKEASRIYSRWLDSEFYELKHVYRTYSEHKEIAYDEIKAYMREIDGRNLKILSANGYQFTCAFISNNGCTLYYFSSSHNVKIDLTR